MYLLWCFLAIMVFIVLLYALAKRFPAWRKVYIVVAGVALLGYLVWRGVFTLAFSSVPAGVFSVVLYLAELLGGFVALFFMVLFFKKDAKVHIKPPWPREQMPSVDIFISTYNEPEKLVLASALAAAALSYPNKKVFICDDGRRDFLRKSAEALDIGYITREDNKHAKAGNVNHALAATNGDFVMLLDADFIVKPCFIYEAMPHFMDDKVAMVQFPQMFYNKDPFQMMNDDYFNEQDFFMRYIEPKIAEYNSLVHVGTNAIIRRSALHDIGGVPTSSITEDMATGMLLQNAGYQTVFINKAFALGVAPFTLQDLKSQRKRWARGTIQVFKNIKPLFLSGLSIKQKTIYLALLFYWFTSFQKIIYITIPTVFMVFGVPLANIAVPPFLLFLVPTLVLSFLSFSVLIGKVRTYTRSHIYDTLMSPYHASAILKELFHTTTHFHVTPKEVNRENKTNYRPVVPHIVLTIWLFIALMVAVAKMVLGIEILPLLVCTGWTLYNLYGLIFSIHVAKERPAETAGDALSVPIEETVRHNEMLLPITQMSFDGFWIKPEPDTQHKFIPGETYAFQNIRTGFQLDAQFLQEDKHGLEFIYANLSKEKAYHMNAYYVEKIHAAHALAIDAPDDGLYCPR